MSGENVRGRFVWYDLMTTDPEAAQAFYTAVVGWGTQVWEAPGMSYTMWTAGGTPIGGITKIADEALASGEKPHWLAYVGVPDMDATASRVKELGGKVMVPPTSIPDTGRFSVFADPQGAVLATYASEKPSPEPQDPPPVGHFSWHELLTTDHAAAFDFYADLFGWEKTSAMDMGPAGVYQMYGLQGAPFGGMYNLTGDTPGSPAWLHYARVADANAAAETITRLGGKVVNGPMEVPGGDLIVVGVDPQGGRFAVHEIKSAQA